MNRICKKCLLRDMDRDKFFEDMREYIDHLDADLKADDELYEARLTVCRTCNYLNAGMCRACGCYVEMRAAVEEKRCPYEKW